jgi:hypothetical protein
MDSDAEELMEREGALLLAGYPSHFETISQAVHNYEFEHAVAQIDAAAAACRP